MRGFIPDFVQRRVDHADEIAAVELSRRKIDRNLDVLGPVHGLITCRLEDPFAEWNDQPRFLGNRNEVGWRHEPTRRMIPPQQRLKSIDLVRLQDDEGLVIEFELLAGERLAQVHLQLAAHLHAAYSSRAQRSGRCRARRPSRRRGPCLRFRRSSSNSTASIGATEIPMLISVTI